MELIGYANKAAGLDATFAALADPTRRAILTRLAAGEASVMELAEPFAMSQPAISKHLKVLERAGLISRGSDAQRRPRKLEAAPLADATDWLEQYREFWEAAFGQLDSLLVEMKGTEATAELDIGQGKDGRVTGAGFKNVEMKTAEAKRQPAKKKKARASKNQRVSPRRQKE
jgi:DNA-binding transcriptional ArsR family regulator